MGVKGWRCAKNMISEELLKVQERGRGPGVRMFRVLQAAGLEKNTKHDSIISGNRQ
jgi:hypothetical protein